jgi:hypothetical protein
MRSDTTLVDWAMFLHPALTDHRTGWIMNESGAWIRQGHT